MNLETESISIQHCCSEMRHVKMVSSEALSYGRWPGHIIVLALEIHIC